MEVLAVIGALTIITLLIWVPTTLVLQYKERKQTLQREAQTLEHKQQQIKQNACTEMYKRFDTTLKTLENDYKKIITFCLDTQLLIQDAPQWRADIHIMQFAQHVAIIRGNAEISQYTEKWDVKL